MRAWGLGLSQTARMAERSVRNFFGHRTTTCAAALAYRTLFGIFPFVPLVVALLAVLRFDGFFQWLAEQARSGSPPVPEPLVPTVERGERQIEPLVELVRQAKQRAGGGLLSFGFAVSLYSAYVVAGTQ